MILAGTLWPEKVENYMTMPEAGEADKRKEARGIIVDTVTCVFLEPQLSAGERARAEQLAAEDPRIRDALAAPDYGFAQTMAGVPQLVKRWRTAKTGLPMPVRSSKQRSTRPA